VTGNAPDPNDRSIDATRAWQPADRAAEPPPPNLPRIPGITLQREIARGGMGVVYSGRQDFLDRRVAVKLLSVELGGESFAQRFQREAKILAGIKHPNIVACHMAGTTDDGQSYLVMEFIDGPTLKNWILENGPLAVPAALRLTRAVGQALAHAHTLGIIHRDVKPENILLETLTSTAIDVAFPFTPKIVDLGLARASEGTASLGLTSPGSVMGTPATMSPEQFDEPEAVDFRSDIYGLGCALYEMLTGKPAFRGKKLTEIVTQKRAPVAPNPCSESEVPAAVGAFVQCLLASNRDERPRSYKELDERLAELLDTLARSKPAAPVVGEETEWGAGPMATRPSVQPAADPWQEPKAAPKTTPARGSKPPSPPTTPPPPPTGKAGGPGFLGTAEINFLAEGLGEPGAGPGMPPAPPAFQDPGATGSNPRQPTAVTAAGGTVSTPARQRPGRAAAIVASVLIVGGGAAFLAMGGEGENGKPPEPAPGPVPVVVEPAKPEVRAEPKVEPKLAPVAVANRAPAVEGITGEPSVTLRKSSVFEVRCADPDGDALSYAWSGPFELVGARGPTNDRKVRFDVIDGLPGVEFEIAVAITDSKGATATATKKLVIADFAPELPLIGFESKAEWRLDASDRAWKEITDPTDRHVLCRANKADRFLRTQLGDEQYWEWFGSLTSAEDQGTDYARTGVRFEFGERAIVLQVHRRGDRGRLGSIEVLEATRTGTTWTAKGLDTPVRKEWQEPEDADDEYRGWFSAQRRGDRLVIRIGEARLRPDGKEVVGELSPPFTFPIAADVSDPQLELFVLQGIGAFRLGRR
jgi:serine/threonine protein kinase